MKVFINRKLRRNPWGGGVHFATSFADYVSSLGHKVTTQYEDDVDIIFMLDPRDDDGFGDVNQLLKYKLFLQSKNKNVKVIHRINDTDVARGTNFLVDLNIRANYSIADKTIFISDWLKDHYEKRGFSRESCVIKNGCNLEWFYPQKNPQNTSEVIKVVTHHWSDNYNKGFDAYIELDKQLSKEKNIEFTYIGRYYKGYHPQNTIVVNPLYGQALGDELRKHDVYITSAKYEACGMHHIEAAACGLPIAYHKDGGAIVEICKNYGIMFEDAREICKVIKELYEKKSLLQANINYDSLNSSNVNSRYFTYMTS